MKISIQLNIITFFGANIVCDLHSSDIFLMYVAYHMYVSNNDKYNFYYVCNLI